MTSLKTLKISGVRGIRELELPLEGSSLLLWGENGWGKSSIVDALEYFFRGSISHLQGTRGLSIGRHGTHLDYPSGAASVTGVFNPNTVTITRMASGVNPDPPSDIRDLWEQSQRTNFLRRSQLLYFIYSDPADRTRALASLIGVEELDTIEMTMLRVRVGFQEQVDAHQAQIVQLNVTLGTLIGEPVAEPDDVLSYLATEANGIGLTPITSIGEIGSGVATWLQSAKQADQDKLNKLATLKGKCQEALEIEPIVLQIKPYKASFDSWLSRRDDLLHISESTFLEAGLKLLESAPWTECPLCQQAIDLQTTTERIRERKTQYMGLSTEFAGFRKMASALGETISVQANRIRDIAAAIPEDHEGFISQRPDLLQLQADLTMAATLVKESTELKSTCDVEQMTLSLDRTKKLAQKMTVDIEGILGQLPLSARDKQILRLVPIANQLSSLSQRLDKVRQDDQRSKELTRRASVIYDTFHETKNNVIGKIYDSIQEDVRRFYEALHPGEGHGNFQMQLDTERRASTELLIDSFGRGDFDPRALSSDGHLDSLGLCIFLAFAKSFAESSKFMVLDDVIMSIDSSHRSRVAALLLNEFSEWQIIITTHDEIWFEEFRRHQQAYKAEGKFSNLRITGWSLDEGPLIEGCRSSWEQIESKLGDADKKGAGNAGRQYLEWVLRELCITSQTSLPAKRHPRYTADEMLPPLQDRLTKLLPEKTNEIKWTPSSGQR